MSVEKFQSIWFTGVRYLVYSFIIAMMVLGITWEAGSEPTDSLFNENSILEHVQLLVLLLIATLSFLGSRFVPKEKTFSFILAWASSFALIRELDSFLDKNLFDGAWQLFASTITILTFMLVRNNLQELKKSAGAFINRSYFGMLISGFITVTVFSRLFGRGVFWHLVMHDSFIPAVKRAAEEGTELLGYTFILFAVMEFFSVQLIGKTCNASHEPSALQNNMCEQYPVEEFQDIGDIKKMKF